MEVYPSRTQLPELLPQPVLAGVIGGVCFLSSAVIFSTVAACIMNHRRAARLRKRRQGKGGGGGGELPWSAMALAPEVGVRGAGVQVARGASQGGTF